VKYVPRRTREVRELHDSVDVDRSMRVLLLTAYFDTHRGGIEIVAGRLADQLAQAGVDLCWAATDSTQPTDSTDFTTLPLAAYNGSERRFGLPFPLPRPSAAVSIWRAVKAADAVLMHDSLYLTNVVAMIAARRLRTPVVLVQHIGVVPYDSRLLRGLMTLANRIVGFPMLASADQVVFISDTVARYFNTVRFKAPPRLVFNGVDTKIFNPGAADFDPIGARKQLGLPTETPLVLFVGRFVEKKGLQIIERIARRRPDITFALAGWGVIDPISWNLPNVHVLTGLEATSLVPLYRASDVFLLPSIGEGLPLVIQEALAYGTPVVCGAESAAADPSASGFLVGVEVDNSEPEGAAASFDEMLQSTLNERSIGDRRQAAMARHEFVRCQYSWTEAANTYRTLMNDLVSRGSAHRA
jgi:glycosyltransferase involved in cell wall biosynthesis